MRDSDLISRAAGGDLDVLLHENRLSGPDVLPGFIEGIAANERGVLRLSLVIVGAAPDGHVEASSRMNDVLSTRLSKRATGR